MKPIKFSKSEAREFIVRTHFLSGPKLPPGKGSVVKILKRFRAIQVDSINVCGTSQDISLNSRIENYTPDLLYKILYKNPRQGFEAWSKCLCILPTEARPYYEQVMSKRLKTHSKVLNEYSDVVDFILNEIYENGPMMSADFKDDRRIKAGWTQTVRLMKNLLDILWETGRIMIHHRKGRIRYFDLTERCLPDEKTSEDDISYDDFLRRLVMDRFQAMRFWKNKGVSANWFDVKEKRNEVFKEFLDQGKILEVDVDGSTYKYFILAEDKKFLRKRPMQEKTARLIAPLDSMVWDKVLIDDIFNFYPAFEVYKPKKDRRYGYYCLYILYGSDFVGRCDVARDKKAKLMDVISIHWEPGVKVTDRLLKTFADALSDHRRFLGLDDVRLPKSKFSGSRRLKKLLD